MKFKAYSCIFHSCICFLIFIVAPFQSSPYYDVV